MLKVSGIATFDAVVRQWFSAVEGVATKAAVGLANASLQRILINSPQYSGDFVANWKVGIGQPDYSFTPNVLGAGAPRQMGDREAIDYALAAAATQWGAFRLGQKIFLSNSAMHLSDSDSGELDPYAWKIEEGLIKFRPVNAGADHVVARAAEYVLRRYSTIGKSELNALNFS